MCWLVILVPVCWLLWWVYEVGMRWVYVLASHIGPSLLVVVVGI